MKLFTRYNRTNIISTIAIFAIGSVAFFFVLRYVLIQQLDEDLESEQQEIIQYVNKYNHFAPIIQTRDQLTTIDSTTIRSPEDQFYSSQEWNPLKKEKEWFREIKFTLARNRSTYVITVSDSEEDTYDLLQLIIVITLAMIALILVTGFFINRVILNRLWKPFYTTIEEINNYNLNTQQPLLLGNTNIDEFNLLNKNIAEMVERTHREYKKLKEFTGNAAHEMQTPLAIIRTKLDILAQHENLHSKNVQPIHDIELAVHKLSRLFSSLLLLTKIENGQFDLKEEVVFAEIIENKLVEFAHLIEANTITIHKDLGRAHIMLHQQLADILIGNLLNNAIRYNHEMGIIFIVLNAKTLTISNTSLLPLLDESLVFQRFYRQAGTRQEGNGLGLSIVKQICDIAGYSILYKYYDDQHVISILF